MKKFILLMLIIISLSACATDELESSVALVIQKETNGHYDRKDWGDWSKVGTCNTRVAVLERDGKNVKTKTCKIIAGQWISYYDNQVITDSTKMDIDHIVPLKEANDSGADKWNSIQRNKFYNDQENLIAVSQKSNRSKGDKDLAEFLPSFNACDYYKRYVHIKIKYSLSIDSRENATINIEKGKC